MNCCTAVRIYPDLKGELDDIQVDLKGELHDMQADLKGELHDIQAENIFLNQILSLIYSGKHIALVQAGPAD